MIKFFKTSFGKTLVFLLCVFSICLTLLSVTANLFMVVDSDLNFYTNDAETIKNTLNQNRLSSYSYTVLYDLVINEDSYSPYSSMFSYQITDDEGEVVVKSEDYPNEQLVYTDFTYLFENSYDYFQGISADSQKYNYKIVLAPLEGSGIAQENQLINQAVTILYKMRYSIFVVELGGIIASILSFVALMSLAGKSTDNSQIKKGYFNWIPFDILTLVYVLLLFLSACWIESMLNYEFSLLTIYPTILLIVLVISGFIMLCMSLANRVKTGSFLKNNVIYYCLSLIYRFIKWSFNVIIKIKNLLVEIIDQIPSIWKTAVVIFVVSLVELIALSSVVYTSDLIGFFLLEKIIVVPVVLYYQIFFKKLSFASERLAKGDSKYQVDTKYMIGQLKKHGENLNNLANGINVAVEERLKSERMKTELITNVSHDLKTPLTSIINYASLIGEQKCENQTIMEYSKVLVRQSERLKRLIEDLVEASKASTGNLEMNLTDCEASVFVTQASGEYEDKLKNNDLTLIVSQPEKELHIMADGRRMWRIFDNLMNNICKYSQKGTRVYLSLQQVGDDAVFIFKNTSSAQLNMSEEELMERFTRGDSSRNTEGNGLGLSIAKSMAKLQNGELKLMIDGDLFKAILSFPLVEYADDSLGKIANKA
ncbi:MAG: sensor histidine kinase [Erysipelotrichaceae bacterium]